jgi:hypothetical protein
MYKFHLHSIKSKNNKTIYFKRFLFLKFVYNQAFDLYKKCKSQTTTLADYTTIVIPDRIIDNDITSSADYSTDIHRHLNDLQKILIETIGRPVSEHILRSQENEEL